MGGHAFNVRIVFVVLPLHLSHLFFSYHHYLPSWITHVCGRVCHVVSCLYEY